MKRKAPSQTPALQLAKKPKRADSFDDPTRSYCLSKLQDVFRDIFLRYPHVYIDGFDAEVAKTEEDLTEGEKESVLSSADQFARELESCVFDIYCEPDKHAGAKYK